mgnify:FL=1|jgi:hypothetical protein|tara:strand:- start:40 stop:309 length:270 start_codon:yes stop_codon:yes gene_type:complete
MGTEDIIKLISELGLPIAISLGLAYVLYKIIMWLLKDVVESTLRRFDEKHRVLQESMVELHNDIEKIKKWNAEIKSDLKVYIDLTMKGK